MEKKVKGAQPDGSSGLLTQPLSRCLVGRLRLVGEGWEDFDEKSKTQDSITSCTDASL